MQYLMLVPLFMRAGCPAPLAQKDFFECGANNELVACPVGESPDPGTYGDCRSVGDGDTTLDDGNCL